MALCSVSVRVRGQVNATNTSQGAEIGALLADLRKSPLRGHMADAEAERFRGLQQLLDGRGSLQQFLRRRRDMLDQERAWALAEVHGYEKGLALVDGAGVVKDMGEVDRRLRRQLDGRLSLAREISVEIEELDLRVEGIEAEVATCQDQMVDLLRRSVLEAQEKALQASEERRRRLAELWAAQLQTDRTRMWSPVAVMAYRVWRTEADGLHGAWQRWSHPHQTATCSKEGDLPHTDGRCAKVAFGCGVYAAKCVHTLMEEFGGELTGRFAVGLVGLEGRVVEHERGYRAERATVLALAVVDRGAMTITDDAGELVELFAAPSAPTPLGSGVMPNPPNTRMMRTMIRKYLEKQARRNATWTSVNPNG